ncbi:hypothetical protein ASG63_16660 [Methylobacterium sp. Leaf94]|uniref:hypothetical protein n=1 Tax=Methylobacterium sp. Leaf94 TaxID=1736250 RepID=UPI0006F6BF33|nr:hypothetical protein [Methylobacterium sp. Leaf94]KQU31125.1 hypothetical protein ASG63_16660 [Methylobacterium sp. Leaf94]
MAVIPFPKPCRPIPVHVPELRLTFEMYGHNGHIRDRCVMVKGIIRVACPPFALHDCKKAGVRIDPKDEFLGQIVSVTDGRGLLFRRTNADPSVTSEYLPCEPGDRYVLIRFRDPDGRGHVFGHRVAGESDADVHEAIAILYRRHRRERPYNPLDKW